ncbi:hypothetical protein SAMN04488057_103300 [Cyclobacterium lianum]|uniref:Uncharacterized protein n=1 Tax=Cyclobacterium lianum TaxID=388280 RepID=A0A1M7LIL2_9BACT|nr:hypothetical protein SAMN04488057_103300 [Cyclobacterium lianum]
MPDFSFIPPFKAYHGENRIKKYIFTKINTLENQVGFLLWKA